MVVTLLKLQMMGFENSVFRWDECLSRLLFQPLKNVPLYQTNSFTVPRGTREMTPLAQIHESEVSDSYTAELLSAKRTQAYCPKRTVLLLRTEGR